jgi:hypothetical protein
MKTDNRLENLVQINVPGRVPRVSGVWAGPRSGTMHETTRSIVSGTENLMRAAFDIRGNRNFGPIEIGNRLREATAPTLNTVNDAGLKLGAERASLRDQMRQLNPVKGYKDCGHWQAAIDLRLIDWFCAQPIAQRSALEHQMRLAPVANLDLSEALLRVPRQLSGLKDDSREEIKLGLIKALRHAEFEEIDMRRQQLHIAEETLRVGIEMIREVGSVDDLIQSAPAAFEFTKNSETPLSWLSPAETAPLDTVTQ